MTPAPLAKDRGAGLAFADLRTGAAVCERPFSDLGPEAPSLVAHGTSAVTLLTSRRSRTICTSENVAYEVVSHVPSDALTGHGCRDRESLRVRYPNALSPQEVSFSGIAQLLRKTY